MTNEMEMARIINVILEVNQIYVVEVDKDGYYDINYSDRYNINYKVAEALVNAGIGNKKQAVKEFCEKLKREFFFMKNTASKDALYQFTDSQLDRLFTELYETKRG